MSTKRACAAWAILTSLAAYPAWADQITLKNGDRITGSIVKKEGKNLTLKSDLMGTVTVPWDQVTDIQSTEPLNVVVAGQKVHPPAVTKATITQANGQVTLSGGLAGPQTLAPGLIEAIRNGAEESAYERMLDPGLFQLWTGTASVGLAGTAGNAKTSTFTTALNASRVTHFDTIAIYFNTVTSSAAVSGVDSDTARAIRGGWKYDRHAPSRVEISAFNDYEYDRFQGLDLRFVLGGGLGYRGWRSSRGNLSLQAGFDYDHDRFAETPTTAAFSRSSSEGYWGDDFKFKLSGSTDIVQSFRMFDNLTHLGEYRTNFDLSSNTKLRRWLVWNLTVSDRYLSNPAEGRKRNDVLYTTGIGFTFGH